MTPDERKARRAEAMERYAPHRAVMAEQVRRLRATNLLPPQLQKRFVVGLFDLVTPRGTGLDFRQPRRHLKGRFA